MKTILYIGWIGYNNLGDELMWRLFQERFEARFGADGGDTRLVASKPGVPTDDMSIYAAVVLGGGSLLIPGYIDLAHAALTAGKPVVVWGSGYDRLDVSAAATDPSPAWIDGRTAGRLADLTDGAAYFGVRGPLTYRLLELAGVPLRGAIVSGDPGLLLPRRDETERDGTSRTIGINWGTTYNRLLGGDESRVEDALAAAAREWLRQGFRLYLYPVWGPDRAPLARLAGKIAEGAGDGGEIEVEQQLLDTGALIEKLAACRFTVNFKLHANLLSYAAGVPFLCLGYRFKCFDFAHSVGISDFVLPTDSPRLAERMLEAAEQLENEREQTLRRMNRCRDVYRERLEAPFARNFLL